MNYALYITYVTNYVHYIYAAVMHGHYPQGNTNFRLS